MRTIEFLYQKRIYLLILILPAFLLGCRGKQGPRGMDGALANRIIQFDKKPSEWTGDENGYKTTLNIPELTEDIYQNGAVLVYKLNEDTQDKYANLLPYTYLSNSSTEYMDFNAYIGRIEITLRWTDNMVNTTQAPVNDILFKVVLIEGTNISDLKKSVSISNIENVERYFNYNKIENRY